MGKLPKFEDDRLIVGIETSDDAAVYKVTDDIAMIQTVDFFTPIVDDPYMFGQIAAANSLSDVYAMGGEPKVALNIVGFPNCLDPAILGEILAGGNTYIHVQYDYDAISKATEANIEKAESLVNEIDDYYVLFKDEKKEIVLCKQNELFGIEVFENESKYGSVKVPFCSADRMKWTVARMFATNFAEVA